jgi:hypothetical protein
MALNSDNVNAALTGAVYYAPLGTVAPTDPATAWGTGWIDLGYCSEDGLVEGESRKWDEIKAWQNRAIVRRLLTENETTFKFTLIENTRYALELRHAGSTMTTTTGVHTMDVMVPEEAFYAWGFDIIDGDEHHRIVLPKGSVTEVEDVTYANGEAIGYGFTVAAYPAGSGLVAVKMSDNAAWDAAA